MKEQQQKHSLIPSSQTALKAGMWYIACTFITKGLAFFSTPIYARIMSKTDMGAFSNLASWLVIFSTATACDFHTSVIRSKYDFDGDVDSYAFSVLTLTYCIVGAFAAVGAVFHDFLFHHILRVDEGYGVVLLLYLLFFPAYNIFATLQRVRYRYQIFSCLSLGYAVVSIASVLTLLKILPDGLCARILGQYGPMILIGFGLSIYIASRGKKVHLSHWKYALKLCLPLLPHLVAIYGMSGIGKMVVRQMMGADATAVFAIAYSGMHILSLLVQSANQGWAPWMLDMLHAGRKSSVRKAGRIYLLGVLAMVLLLMLFAPELVLFLGGSGYAEAVALMPALLTVCLVQMLYMVYLQTEFYEKKVMGIGLHSAFAAVVTIAVCLLLTKRWGLEGAGWGVLLGYGVLLLTHYLGARKLGHGDVMDEKLVAAALACSCAMSLVAPWLYRNNGVRLLLIVLYVAAGSAIAYRFRSQIKSFVFNFLRKK